MCKVLQLSRSSYYNWLKCEPSKRWLANERIMFFIKKIFEVSFGSYGAPRIREDLKKYGYFVSKKESK
ncbi:IS3 family transposase [Pontimicrobium sp. MEBiC01747]